MKCPKCGYEDDKIKHLQLIIKEIDEKVKEAKSEFEVSKRFMEIAKGMDKNTAQNFQVYSQFSKEYLARELDALRLNAEKIQKISPDAFNVLNEIIKHYEDSHKMLRQIAERYKDTKAGDMSVLEILAFMLSFGGIMQKVHESIEACSFAIRDTAKRFES